MSNGRLKDLHTFYLILSRLQEQIGGAQTLASCPGRIRWPNRGVYFFYENGEKRSDTGEGPRVVRVGTHALKDGSRTTLWTRLSQHRGQVQSGGGNHRGSIFRLIVGESLINRERYQYPTWGKGRTAPRGIRDQELMLEQTVSKVICAMPFVWLAINDEAGPASARGDIERNSIALLSNYGKPALDPPSTDWLGQFSSRERIRSSGLWNSNHVDETYDPSFLDRLNRLADSMGGTQ